MHILKQIVRIGRSHLYILYITDRGLGIYTVLVQIHVVCNPIAYVREALYRILMTVLGRQIGQAQYTRLLERLGFHNKTVINYTEFFALFRKANEEDTSYPRWMDPVQRTHLEKATMNAEQVHQQLKERVRQR